MIGTPLLLTGIAFFGIERGLTLAGVSALLIVLPVALFVLKRDPQAMGLLPDGAEFSTGQAPKAEASWSLKGVLGS